MDSSSDLARSPEALTSGPSGSGPKQHRRWSDADKARIVTETFQSDAKVTDVARRHGVNVRRLSEWRSKARQGKLALFDAGAVCAFTPLVVDADAAGSRLAPHDGTFDVVVGDVTVRLDGAIDVARLARIVHALNGRLP
jgi:transposase